MNYRLEVASAGGITADVKDVMLLWTQLPDIPWDRVRRELLPWFNRMARYGVIIASRFDFHSEEEMLNKIEFDIKRCTKRGDLIVDPFCGSSNVGIVALELDRRYFGCDISQICIDRSESRLYVHA